MAREEPMSVDNAEPERGRPQHAAPEESHAAASVVGLQRAAGNAAVARYLASTRVGRPPRLGRFFDEIVDAGHEAVRRAVELAKSFVGPISIASSVGRGGRNDPEDIAAVHRRLALYGYLPLEGAPVIDELVAAIERFQTERAGFTTPDGRVDPGGKTLRALNGETPARPSDVDPATPETPRPPREAPAEQAWMAVAPRRTTTTGEGRNRRWRQETDVGIVGYRVPERGDTEAVTRHREQRPDVELVYTDADARAATPTDDPQVVAACEEVERFRDQIGELDALRAVEVGFQRNSGRTNATRYVKRGYIYGGQRVPLTTSLDADASYDIAPIDLPSEITREELHEARLALWHEISGNEGTPASVNAYDSANLTWGGGFAAAGQLQRIVTAAFELSPTMQRLFESAGMSVRRFEETGSLEFVALDTQKRWQLVGDDAERYIRTDRRLLSLLGRIGSGTVSAQQLGPDAADENRALRSVVLDAQFAQLARGSARLHAEALRGSWTLATRAAVAHSLHAGGGLGSGATFWPRAAQEADGTPLSVLRMLVDAWLKGRDGTIDARPSGSHYGRVLGPASHGAFEAVLEALPDAPEGASDGQFIRTRSRRVQVRP
jgi:hypothetical protein